MKDLYLMGQEIEKLGINNFSSNKCFKEVSSNNYLFYYFEADLFIGQCAL